MSDIFKRQAKTRSPIAKPSLPHAGESLEVQLRDRYADVTYWAVMIAIGVIWSLWEWARYWLKLPYVPWTVTIMSALLAMFAIWRIWRVFRELPQLHLAVRGERTVGQLLEKFRAHGYHVFHDLEEEDYNIDHVIIGPGGVFSIETKTRSKPIRGQVSVTFDGEFIRVNGVKPDRDPVIQAKAASRRVRKILCEQTGVEVWVTPVVIFPGWFVETTVQKPDVVVLNDSYFSKWITNRPPQLSDDHIRTLSAGMDRYLRGPA